jgi:hypothetical protein
MLPEVDPIHRVQLFPYRFSRIDGADVHCLSLALREMSGTNGVTVRKRWTRSHQISRPTSRSSSSSFFRSHRLSPMPSSPTTTAAMRFMTGMYPPVVSSARSTGCAAFDPTWSRRHAEGSSILRSGPQHRILGGMSDAAGSRRNAPIAVTGALIVLGVLFVVVAVVYFTSTAAGLPSFFPGHQAGSSHHHTKHDVVFLALALVSFIGAWLATGRRKATEVPTA